MKSPFKLDTANASYETPPPDRMELNPKEAIRFAQDLFKIGHTEDAYKIFAQVSEIEPENWDAAHNAGFCLAALKRYQEALPWYDRAMAISVTEANICTLNKAQALGEAGRSDEAIHMLERGILRTQPNHAHAHYNLGVLLMQTDRFEEARNHFEQSLKIDPDCAAGDAKFCRGFANLVLGNYLSGFSDFEHRLKDNIYAKAGPAQGKELQPEHDVKGKTVLVLSVMGRGDVIQFGRFLPLLVERGANVLVTADRGTEQLFADLPGVTVFAESDVLPTSDYWCHMMGLAHVFRITVDTVPPPLPLTYDARLLAQWGEFIPYDQTALHVGLCWAGSPTSRYDEHRSIPLKMLQPLIDLAKDHKVYFHGLHQGIRDSDTDAYKTSYPHLINIGHRFTDFRQTAHALKCLDLVITVDTSVAHMAGTVGVPTWIMTTRFRTYWLWLKGRNDTPWYPSVELIRQPVHGNWPSAIEVAKTKLLEIISSR